ncbi:hypothetical protein DCAR_0414768 [Daucus carota subsp. sativus]|uniref:Uncharacterized protein n=1 Tax=Daucus carota subsp. sativus TaxID=79200 RepID=A0AAF0WTD2_DAUCS|nr:hypothetical protein DCAR_0414768 [Daucus carota subsp. sativus]
MLITFISCQAKFKSTAELKIEDLCEDILNLDLNDENRNRDIQTHTIEIESASRTSWVLRTKLLPDSTKDDQDNSWRLFTSEDMVQGYKALKRRKKARIVKNHADFQFTETLGEATMSSVRGTTVSRNMNCVSVVVDARFERKVYGLIYNMHSYSIAEEHQVNSPSAGIIHKFNELANRHVNSPSTGILDNSGLLGSAAVDMDIPSATPKSTITSPRETTPFADITNMVQRNTSHTRDDRVKGKGKNAEMGSNNGSEQGKGKSVNWEDATQKECSRNLFEEEFSTNPSSNSVLYDEDLEETRYEAQILSDDSETDLESSHEVDYGDELFDDESEVGNDTGL